jgi:hypothetical protein
VSSSEKKVVLRDTKGRIESQIRLFSLLDNNTTVAIKYVPVNDKELDIMSYLEKEKINMENILKTQNTYYKGYTIAVELENSYRVPIVMHYYNGDLLDFASEYSSKFHNYLKPHQIMLLGDIIGKTYRKLIKYDLYYTDSKPANILYHWLRKRGMSGKGHPFNVVLTDLGGILKVHRGCHRCKTNFLPREYISSRNAKIFFCPKCNTPLEYQHRRYFNAQTYPYPTKHYNPKKYNLTHENRPEYLEQVVVWGLGILLLRMSLRNNTHQRAFEETFVHHSMTYAKYNNWVENHCDDWCTEHNIPMFVRDILLLKITTLNQVIQETEKMKDTYYNKKRDVKKRKQGAKSNTDRRMMNKRVRTFNNQYK